MEQFSHTDMGEMDDGKKLYPSIQVSTVQALHSPKFQDTKGNGVN